MKEESSVFFTWTMALVAMGLFVPLFATGGLGGFDFWWWMASNAALLTSIVFIFDLSWRRAFAQDLKKDPIQKIILGLGSAAFLYAVFYVGNLASRYLFASASADIDSVYGLKNGIPPWRVSLLIGLLIGPAEEWFWRGFLQRRLSLRYGKWAGFALATALYTGMHLASLNPMLVLAAGVCGVFWGFLYLRTGSLLLCTISHVTWDLSVFIFFPLG